jgi:hypothetical protein
MKYLFYHLLSVTAFTLCTFTAAYTQNPGGVTNNLQFWIKGDYTGSNMTFLSGKITGWSNEKNSSYKLAAPSSNQRPVRHDGSSSNSDSLNYQPQVYFLGNAAMISAGTANVLRSNDTTTYNYFLGTSGTTFTVTNMDSASKNAVTYMGTNNYRYQIKPNFRVQTSDGINIASPLNTSLGYTSDFTSTYNSPRNNARITTSYGFGSSLLSRRNGTAYSLTNSNKAPFCPGISAGLEVGGNTTNNEFFHKGRIAEVIFYNAPLHIDSVRRIETYLAIKYGITLNPNGLSTSNGYVSSSGTSVYSQGSTGTTYWNNIIGLARDASSGLLQKQSHTYDDSIRLYISTLAATNSGNGGTITDNGDFLMIGATTGKLMEAVATASEKPSGITVRLDREWKLINTGFNQSFSMQIKLDGSASGLFSGGGTLRLLADDDGNFTNATKINSGTSGVTLSYSSGIITVTIVPSSSGGIFPVNGTPKYITVASNNGTLDDASIQLICTKNNHLVLLEWKSNSETATDRYEVEKSFDQRNWNTVTAISVKNTNTAPASYQTVDTISENTVYYRIKIISKTGEASYTTVQKISGNIKTVQLQTYPNPVTSFLNVSWTGFKKPERLKIIAADGRIYNCVCTINDFNAIIQTQNLPRGVYILTVIGSNKPLYTKFFKN